MEWGQLQLEQSAWSTHGFVERVANARLKMSIPHAGRRADRAAMKFGSQRSRRRQARQLPLRLALVLGLLVLAALGARGTRRGSAARRSRLSRRAGRCALPACRVNITAHRGTITDRYGEPLAVSTPVDSVVGQSAGADAIGGQLPRLARALKRDRKALARRVTSNLDREFLYLGAPPGAANRRRDMQARSAFRACYLLREYRRYYPAGEVAGHVLGFTSIDDSGQEGLELAYDHWLTGEDGAKRVIQDALRARRRRCREHSRGAARARTWC